MIDAPSDLPVCTVDAGQLLAAWQACKGEPELSCTDSNLMVKRGRIKARIALGDPTAYPVSEPDPKTTGTGTGEGVGALLTRLKPFIATDASRPWATSACLRESFAYATNNAVVCRVPFPAPMPYPVNLPLAVFDAVINRSTEPTDLGASTNSLTFYYGDGVWIKSKLVEGEWPTATIDGLIAHIPDDKWEVPHPELAMVLNTAAKLSNARQPIVQFGNGGLKLTDDAFEAEELEPAPDKGKVNARVAAVVFDRATEVQWHIKPDVHAFKAGDITGVFGGQR